VERPPATAVQRGPASIPKAWKYPYANWHVFRSRTRYSCAKAHALLRNMPVRQQPDHGRHFVRMRRGMHFRIVHLFRLGHTLQHHTIARRTAVTLIGSYVAFSTSTGSCIRDARRGEVSLGSTACGTLGAGHDLAHGFRGVAPPGIHRHVAGLLPSRPSTTYLTTLWCLAGVF